MDHSLAIYTITIYLFCFSILLNIVLFVAFFVFFSKAIKENKAKIGELDKKINQFLKDN